MSGKEFRKWRRSKDITQEEVAKEILVNKSTISRWEHDLINISDNLHNKLNNFKIERG